MTNSDSRLMIYLHIPKTGGTTLSHILDWNYRQVYVINHYDQIPPLLAWSDDEKRRLDCVRGQIFYGLHQYLPQTATYTTMLRHPVKRFVSQYYYTMDRRKREGMADADLTMEQFLESEPFQAYMQLALLRGGATIDEALRTPLGPDALATAKRNIETHFTLAGVLDYYDEMLVLMKRSLGWTRAYYARRNTRAEATPPLTGDLRRRVEQACELDMELYEWVKQRLENTLAEQGDDFQAELATLRRQNRVFGLAYQIAEPLQKTPVWKAMRKTARRLLRR